MTAPFDWERLAEDADNCDSYAHAADLIRTRIEAAFVPVEQRDKAEALLCQRTNEYFEATARAEAAEAENARLLRVIDAYLSATASNSNKRQIVTAALGCEHER